MQERLHDWRGALDPVLVVLSLELPAGAGLDDFAEEVTEAAAFGGDAGECRGDALGRSLQPLIELAGLVLETVHAVLVARAAVHILQQFLQLCGLLVHVGQQNLLKPFTFFTGWVAV